MKGIFGSALLSPALLFAAETTAAGHPLQVLPSGEPNDRYRCEEAKEVRHSTMGPPLMGVS
jgi:hypothetical protein